jgi:hypothetical protein
MKTVVYTWQGEDLIPYSGFLFHYWHHRAQTGKLYAKAESLA